MPGYAGAWVLSTSSWFTYESKALPVPVRATPAFSVTYFHSGRIRPSCASSSTKAQWPVSCNNRQLFALGMFCYKWTAPSRVTLGVPEEFNVRAQLAKGKKWQRSAHRYLVNKGYALRLIQYYLGYRDSNHTVHCTCVASVASIGLKVSGIPEKLAVIATYRSLGQIVDTLFITGTVSTTWWAYCPLWYERWY